jgi:hypothetical protein
VEAMMEHLTAVPELTRDDVRVARLAACCAKSPAVARSWVFRYGVSARVQRGHGASRESTNGIGLRSFCLTRR